MYNQIAGKRLPRIEALSDGVFSIAMTFLASFFEFGGDICDSTQLCFRDFLTKWLKKIRRSADRAGINKALLHYYYRTKDKLYEMVAKSIIHQGIPIIQKTIESDLPLEEKIVKFVDFYIDLIRKNPFIPLFIISEMNKHPEQFFEKMLPARLPRPEIFLKQVEEAVAAGTIRPVNPQHLLLNIISMCVFPFVARPMMQMVLGMNKPEADQFLKQRKVEVTEFIFAALRPR